MKVSKLHKRRRVRNHTKNENVRKVHRRVKASNQQKMKVSKLHKRRVRNHTKNVNVRSTQKS